MTDKPEFKDTDKAFFWEFLSVLFRWRRLLLVNALLAAVITFAVMLFLPNWYKASTTILPPEKDSGGLGLMSSMLSSGLGSLLGGGAALPGMATPSDLYAAVAQSHIVCEGVIEKNDLKNAYKIDPDARSDEIAIKELLQRTQVLVGPEGIMTINYEDKDPKLAAAVANSFVDELNRVNQENMNSKAKSMREFIEKRLDGSIHDLADAEEAYKNFQLLHHTIALDEQVKAAISSMADLRGQLVVAQIELGVMEKTLLPSNSQYQEQEYKVEQIKDQLQKLENGDTLSTGSSVLNLSMGEAPELGLELARLTRELKIQETIFELLKQQYEQAKIQEMRDTPSVQVLDKADIPHTKSRPKRTVFAAMGGIMSFGLSLIFVMILEFMRREKEKNSQAYQKIRIITRMFNEDFYWIRNMFTPKRRKDVS
jgi:tyrosine-protein kinase Etk/Wzc